LCYLSWFVSMKLTAKNNYSIKKRIKRLITKYRGKYYGQNGEDIIVFNLLKILKPISNVVYLDIGAGDPKFLSNTYLLYKMGAQGYCIDANRRLYKKYKKIRPRDCFINYYMGKTDESVNFHIMSMKELSTANEESLNYLMGNGFKTLRIDAVKAMDIRTLCVNFLSNIEVDFISIDVEGDEMEILTDIMHSPLSPSIICVEAVDFKTGYNSSDVYKIKQLMEENGFMLFMNTLVNLIFIKSDMLNANEVIYV